MTLLKLDTKFFDTGLQAEVEEQMEQARQALRSLDDKSCPGSEWTGWWNYPQCQGLKLAREVANFAESVDVFYDLVLVVGIGGSYLGARAVHESLGHSYKGIYDDGKPMLIFLGHHLSEPAMIETLDLLKNRQPIVNVISKSGTTTEPSVAFRVIRKYMEDRFGREETSRRIVVTTDKEKGALKKVAAEEKFKTFVVPDDIGGRYSVLTPVGLVPLALARWDIEALMNGADKVFDELKEVLNDGDHPVLRYASARKVGFQNGKRIEILAYNNPKLFYLIEWWKQLFGESEGKDGKGLFPTGLALTTDLHSLGQYVQDGVRNLMETFLVFEDEAAFSDNAVERSLKVPMAKDNLDQLGYLEGRPIGDINQAAMVATKIAHADGGVPCLGLTVGRLDEYHLGGLLAFFETACAVSGILLGVNPFDQPGVEAYKKNLFGLMGKPGFEEIGTSLKERV